MGRLCIGRAVSPKGVNGRLIDTANRHRFLLAQRAELSMAQRPHGLAVAACFSRSDNNERSCGKERSWTCWLRKDATASTGTSPESVRCSALRWQVESLSHHSCVHNLFRADPTTTGGTHLGREMNASGCQDVTLEARPLGPPHAAAAGPYPDLACLRACLSGRPRGAGPHAGAVILQQARPMRCIAGSGADVPPAHLQGLQGRIGLASPRRRVRTAPPAWRRNACANSNQPDHVRLGSMRGIASRLRPR